MAAPGGAHLPPAPGATSLSIAPHSANAFDPKDRFAPSVSVKEVAAAGGDFKLFSTSKPRHVGSGFKAGAGNLIKGFGMGVATLVATPVAMTSNAKTPAGKVAGAVGGTVIGAGGEAGAQALKRDELEASRMLQEDRWLDGFLTKCAGDQTPADFLRSYVRQRRLRSALHSSNQGCLTRGENVRRMELVGGLTVSIN